MGFIDKIEPIEPVLSIKFTSEGRRLLSEGKLNAVYYALGDSEINYEYLSKTGIIGSQLSILKPVDTNPNILSFVKKSSSSDSLNTIGAFSSEEILIKNTQVPIGFFNYTGNTASINSTNPYVKISNAYALSSDFSGNRLLNIQTSNFASIGVGDILVIKMINSSNSSTTGNTITGVIPCLKYKITRILASPMVEVDRNLPNLSSFTNSKLGIYVLKAESFTGNTVTYDDQDIDNASFSNYICGMEDFPFWKMSLIFTDEIAGVTGKSYSTFNTAKYAGFVSYIQSQRIKYKNLGVIHYSNTSPLNTYGEALFDSTPVLSIPTIMWHKSSGTTIGAKFFTDIDEKYFEDIDNPLDTRYHDLIDESGNVVGKVFNDLKLFVIEDQDLLFALSYKSNRSWTLPNFSVEVIGSQAVCATCDIVIKNVVYSAPINYYSQASLTFNVDYLSPEANGYVIVEAFSGGTSTSGGTSVYMKRLSPDIITSKYVLTLNAGNYSRFEVRDIGVPDCVGFIDGRNIIQPTPTMTPTMTLTPTPTPTPVPQTFGLTIDSVSGGTSIPVAGTHYYNSGATAVVTAYPNLNYIFDRWVETVSGNVLGLNATQSIIMNSDKRIKPIFSYNGVTIPTIIIDNDDSYSASDSLRVFSDVTSDGGASVNVRGIVWSATNPNPTIGGSGCTYTNIGSGTGAMTTIISPLSGNTTYYVRAYAENSQGTAYSNVISPSTSAIPVTYGVNWTFVEGGAGGQLVIIKNGSSSELIQADSGSGTIGGWAEGDMIEIYCYNGSQMYSHIVIDGDIPQTINEQGVSHYIGYITGDISVYAYTDNYEF